MQEFNEKGSWGQIKNKYEASPQVCPDLSGMPLDLSQTFTAFLVLIFGVVTGFILMLIECCIQNLGMGQVQADPSPEKSSPSQVES